MYTSDQLKEIEIYLSERQSEIETLLQKADAPDTPEAEPMPVETRRRLDLERTQLMTAIKRIQDGKFGVCVLCKQNIPIERLELVPESPLCAPCFEKRNKSTGRR